MSNKVFITSDSHFSHRNIAEKFTLADGVTKCRPFSTVEEMDAVLVANWNAVVGPDDIVWHLGDVVLNYKYLPIVGQLNGRKRLIMGNHDLADTKEYLKYFENCYGSYKLDKYILSHVPTKEDQLPAWCLANLHGHIHNELLGYPYGNLCVEHTKYAPVEFSELLDFLPNQWSGS